ncbi:endonuclease [Anabaena minutissima FACHB-250]|nr:endonuclease [Anabaena minutissima FACHB-250]
MDTKLRGDIYQFKIQNLALERSEGSKFKIKSPDFTRVSYFGSIGNFGKLVLKRGWGVLDNRRTKANRRLMLRAEYQPSDFDFALAYIEPLDIFYVFPVDVFIGYGSEIHLVETEKRQRQPRSAKYREAWELILQAVDKESFVFSPVQFGEAGF